jgi:NAD(P)H-dependent FMN reductase
MKIGIIVGSHRQQSQSTKIGAWFASQLESQGVDSWTLDMASNPFPMWDESIWEGNPEWTERLTPMSAELNNCDGLIIISPEWSGMVPPALKNFFLLCGRGELAHKPGLIVSVSAGRGGSYPVAELRSSSYKNTRICYLPEHLIVHDVESVFNTEVNGEGDDYIRRRGEYCIDLLLAYSASLSVVRDSGLARHKDFSNGM